MQGLILRESGWSRDVGRKQGIQFAAALSDALAQWPEISKTQQELVDLCCFDLYDKLALTCCESSAWQIYHYCSEHKVNAAASLCPPWSFSVPSPLTKNVISLPKQEAVLFNQC